LLAWLVSIFGLPKKELADYYLKIALLQRLQKAQANLVFIALIHEWPLPVAASAMALGLSLLIGWWLTLIALGALVYQHYRFRD